MSGPLLKDSRWVRQSFLVKKSDLDAVEQQNRIFTTASQKFTDTSPGGNLAINPPAQFTRYADLKAPGRFQGNVGAVPGSRGMGRYYSEAIDDHSQLINMRFGVPAFNSMERFFTSFYDTGAGQLARTGRANSAFYFVGRAAGFIVGVMSWKILAVHLLGVGIKAFTNFILHNQKSKFYYLKPAMPLYWNAVQTMVNQIAVNRGIVPRVGTDEMKAIDGSAGGDAGENGGNELNTQQLHALMPDIFREKGGIDVYAVANRAQRLARKHYARMHDTLKSMPDNATTDDLSSRLHQIFGSTLGDTPPQFTPDAPSTASNTSYLGRWFASMTSQTSDAAGGKDPGNEKALDGSDDGFFDFLKAELDDGGAFVTFRVNATGQVSESFSNSVAESAISQKINGMAASGRSTNFSFAGGNLSDGVIGQTIGGIIGATKDLAAGVGDSMGISGLAVLAGSAFADIPKNWEASQAQLPRAQYTISLVSPYGNAISQMINLHIPLAMLLAAVLPLSTGKHSYTSPFLVELYDQGRCQTRLGMIDSMQITRGTGNLAYNTEGHAMAIEVTFSVIDMSSIMHMPITQGFTLAKVAATAAASVAVGIGGGPVLGTAVAAAGAAVAGGVFDDDNVFTDYMAILSGMGLADQIYQWRKLKLNITRARANWDSFTSASRFASFAADTLPGRLVSSLYTGTYRDSPSVENLIATNR